MSNFPSAPAFSSPTPDTGTGVPRLEAWLKANKQGLWTAAPQALTIATGAITPADGTTGSIEMDTEASAATDTLDTIAQTNLPDGFAVCLQIADNGRVITINHNAGGTGQISLHDGLDFEMNRVGQRLILQREGTSWVEIGRFGREKTHTIGGAGEPAFQNSWSSAGFAPAFWKDNEGVVHLQGNAQKASVASANSTIFTLPAGYRPSGTIFRGLYAVQGATVEFMYVEITTGGVVTWNRPAGAPSTVTVQVELGGVSFRAEA